MKRDTRNITTSKKLIKNTQNFLSIKYYSFTDRILKKDGLFFGWGRKISGQKALALAKKHNSSFVLLEDSFIRSLGLGVDGSPSFSIVEDDVGIYYDATTPSKLENILTNYAFKEDTLLAKQANEAMLLIRKHDISKYNHAPLVDEQFFEDVNSSKVLIIAQTAGDASLEYGLGNKFSTRQMIEDAIKENPKSAVYIKIHPDVLAGKKKSDIVVDEIPSGCIVLDDDVNPISLLKHFDKVYTKTSGMGMEALILGLEVVCYGMPYYAGWGVTIDKQSCARRKRKLTLEELFAGAYILYTRYYNPYAQKPSDIIDTIETIVKYRAIQKQNNGNLYFFGFSRWKQKNTRHFFKPLSHNKIYFCNTLEKAKEKGLNNKSKIYIWGKKKFEELESYAQEQNILLSRVEDGFVRSVSLGSDLTNAYSLVVDQKGIYFDATGVSDLENILNSYTFDNKLLERAKNLQTYLVEKKLSKYNLYADTAIVLPNKLNKQKLVLVVGQVEDDASIEYGGWGMDNLALLKEARKNRPNEYIVYKPHPDVLVGNRVGAVTKENVEKYADIQLDKVSLPSVLDVCDELHTITSLSGFEALLRGKEVYTYGLPFYAGWGLTVDKRETSRRKRELSLLELLAATYIVYPRYVHPQNHAYCEVEVLLEALDKEKNRYNNSKLYKLYINSRNFISRKIQFMIKVGLGEYTWGFKK